METLKEVHILSKGQYLYYMFFSVNIKYKISVEIMFWKI